MFRLSIVIPACRQQVALETTLLSVLENRPASCEVLIVCPADYQDQYGLDDEVRFVRLPKNSQRATSWPEMANCGLAESLSQVVHVLQPGILVEEGWVDAAMELLDYETDVAAVSPLVFEPGRAAPLTGVLVGRGGKRLEVQHGSIKDQDEVGFAPSRVAGFFRRSCLAKAGGWDTNIAAELADVELGCALALQGERCKVARMCQVKSMANGRDLKTNGFAVGLANEMIIRRYSGLRKKGLGSSAVVDALGKLPHPQAFAYLLGRIAGRLHTSRRTKNVSFTLETPAQRDPNSRAA